VKHKPAVLRARAEEDIQAAIDFYLEERSQKAALGFIDALERSLRELERHPAMGSERYAHELDLPGLRFWPIKGYPYLMFYVEGVDAVDVWRILHDSRDIPTWMAAP